MTVLRKSDAQLDAEAATRPALRVLPAALVQWQGAYAGEPPLHITARHPAVVEDAIEASQVGADLGAAFMRYLFGSGGHDFPVHDSLLHWDRHCRARHSRWPDHRGRAVCAEIAWAVLRDRTSLQWAADLTGVTWDRAERLLALGVAFMRRMQGRWMDEQAEHVSHDRANCRTCRAEVAVALA